MVNFFFLSIALREGMICDGEHLTYGGWCDGERGERVEGRVEEGKGVNGPKEKKPTWRSAPLSSG